MDLSLKSAGKRTSKKVKAAKKASKIKILLKAPILVLRRVRLGQGAASTLELTIKHSPARISDDHLHEMLDAHFEDTLHGHVELIIERKVQEDEIYLAS